MTNPKMTRQEWLKKIDAYESSGLTQKRFCKENGLSFSSFQYYRKDYLSDKQTPLESKENNGFISISMNSVKQDNFTLCLPNGVKISVPSTFDSNSLLKLMEVLRPC